MFLTIITFLIVLSLLVFVHEFGHFMAAKKTGIKVDEFGFGYPPRVWGKKIGDTLYSINLLPIGGFVKLQGEDAADLNQVKDPKHSFVHKSKKVRALVIVAGVIMNFLLAVLVFSVVYTKMGIPTMTDKVNVVGLLPGAPAQQAGIKEKDVVFSVAGEKVDDTGQFIEITKRFTGQLLQIGVQRNGESLTFEVVPRESPPEGEGPLGLIVSSMEMKFYPFWQMPFRGAVEGFKEALAWLALIVGALGGMLYQLITSASVPKDLAGPVGIFQITGQAAQAGVLTVLQFIGILSVNLAVLNILPLPALDGGRLLFIIIETVTGRRVQANAERWVHQIGMLLLLLLFLLITWNDLRRIFN